MTRIASILYIQHGHFHQNVLAVVDYPDHINSSREASMINEIVTPEDQNRKKLAPNHPI
jgi:hypothetical protein